MNSKYAIVVIALILSLLIVNAYANSQSSAIIELNGDGSWDWIATLSPVVVTATPASSQTPWIITATVEPITVTSTVTLTPTPTIETPTPAATDSPILTDTPTPEKTPPPPTITVTTIPPDLETCYATTLTRLNWRTAPTTEADILGIWNAGIVLVVYEVIIVFDEIDPERVDEWAKVSLPNNPNQGWSAAYYARTQYLTYENTQACLDLRSGGQIVTLVWHTVPGFNVENARISHSILKNARRGFGYKTYADMWAALETLINGGTAIYRHGAPDYPQNIGSADPVQSAHDFFYDYGRYACDMLRDYEKAYYEPLNEANFGDTSSDAQLNIIYWWGDWMDAYIDVAFDYRCPKLVLPTPGPGHGSPTHYRIWKDQLNRLAASGGLIGEHAYTPGIEGGLCACDEWLACRHRKNEEWRQAEGVDIDVAITEAARGWGGDPVSVDDFVCYYDEIKCDEFVKIVAFWLLGPHTNWIEANLDNFVIEIAHRIAALDTTCPSSITRLSTGVPTVELEYRRNLGRR